MSAAPVIEVQDVHLSFPLVRYRPRTIKEAALSLLKPKPVPDAEREFWALRGVSMSVARGEVIGLVGKNGSGKSTLLRVIAGIYSADKGSCRADGRISSLLELSAGFREELTGFENIKLNGAILGYSPAEMEALTPEIIQFSGLGDFMSQPLRTYSSGMRARLGFAVAIAAKPTILLIDEALSVGDAEFRAKCMSHIESLVKDADTTVIIVSHSEAELRRLATRFILLERGLVIETGDADKVFTRYAQPTPL